MPERGPRMSGFSLGELCWLFCCPPCPSRIAAKLAFLPPQPTYSVRAAADGSCSLHLTERADWQYTQRELDAVEVFSTRTSRGNRVGCMFVRCAPGSRYTVLFSHGNAVDLGQMCSFYIGLGSRINCNVFSYDYSGYGVSTGKPSEKNLYADIEAAWQVLRTKYGMTPENIILYGQSIGTVPTVDLAARYECAAVILHSPLMSGLRVAFPDTRKTYCFDAFPRSSHTWIWQQSFISKMTFVSVEFTALGSFAPQTSASTKSRRWPPQFWSFTARRTRSSISPTVWPSTSAAHALWSRCGWRAPGTTTSSCTLSIWRD
ncbi:alpha/beta hydrolase domain-containing protein 17C isoform X1 [Colossoma macropomum]|uniref:alpha/beta hydrolase domain-containing protein 17C isoform X1 n=1 Tax=Colossoma macropomum TaxID=42526 RepID=UPI001863EE50|nr:alpha/beta hydrolase domain-containing protein 17C isoform X1 [Colossoma macropomum]